MEGSLVRRLADAAAEVVRAHATSLDELDRPLGDADHGSNLVRGAMALQALGPRLEALPLDEALRLAAAVLGARTGGAGGQLYAVLLGAMADEAPGGRPAAGDLVRMVEAGVAGVRRTGAAAPGQKTMLDVLCPVADALRITHDAGCDHLLGSRALAAAATGLHQSGRHEAAKGRAAGRRAASRGHLDPGACSCALIIAAVVAVMEP